MDCSPTGSFVHGIIQARILEWVAFPSPADLPDPGIEPGSPELQACSLLSEPPGKLTGQLQTKNLMVFGRFEHKHLNKRELDLDALLSCGPGITEYWP